MTLRYSNSEFLTVLDPLPLDGIGWYARVLSERDWSSQIALVDRFVELGFTKEESGFGGGSITLDSRDRMFTDPLPAGEAIRLQDQEALWQVIEDGIVRFEFLAEDLQEDILTEDGTLTTVISGRGTGSVLDWAKILPDATSTTREFVGVPMSVWIGQFSENQHYGYLPFVGRTFDVDVDSAGERWDAYVPSQAITLEAGTSLLELLNKFCEQGGYVWKMLPGFRLHIMRDPGQNREQEVVFTMFRDQGLHQRMVTRREIANVVYAKGSDGWAVAADTTSQDRWRKRATWMSADGDPSARSAVANATLAMLKDDKQSRTIQIEPNRPGKRIFVDFDVSDTVGIETTDGDPFSGSRKVVAVSVKIDVDGVVKPELTLQSRFESRQIRQQKVLDAMGGSKTEGAGAAMPSMSQMLATQKLRDMADVDLTGALAGDVLVMNGAGAFVDATPNLNFLSDVDLTVAPTAGQTLTYDTVTGQWKPGTPAAGGGGGGTMPWTAVATIPGSAWNAGDWTTSAGTWASNGTEITQTATGGTARAQLNQKVITGACIVDVDIMLLSSGSNDTQAGVVIGNNANGSSGALFRLHMNGATADAIQIEQDASSARFVSSGNWGGLNVWKTLRCIVFGGIATLYVDGVLLGSAGNNVTGSSDATYVGLKTNTASVKFRNLKIWNPTMPGTGSGGATQAVVKSNFPPAWEAASTNNFEATSGMLFVCQQNATITELRAKLDSVSGSVYRFGLYEVGADLKTVTAVVGSTTVTETATTTAKVMSSGTVSFNVVAGKYYVLAVTVSTGVVKTYYLNVAATYSNSFMSVPPKALRGGATVNPVVGTVFSSAAIDGHLTLGLTATV